MGTPKQSNWQNTVLDTLSNPGVYFPANIRVDASGIISNIYTTGRIILPVVSTVSQLPSISATGDGASVMVLLGAGGETEQYLWNDGNADLGQPLNKWKLIDQTGAVPGGSRIDYFDSDFLIQSAQNIGNIIPLNGTIKEINVTINRELEPGASIEIRSANNILMAISDINPQTAGTYTKLLTGNTSDMTAQGGGQITASIGGLVANVPFVNYGIDNNFSTVMPGAPSKSDFIHTSDRVDISITGNIDIQCKLALTSWSPGAGTFVHLVSKMSDLNVGGYRFMIAGAVGDPSLQFDWDTGSGLLTSNSITFSFADTDIRFLRVTLDVDNENGGNDTKFYTSIFGVDWTQLGSTVTKVGTTSIRNGIEKLAIGQAPGDGSDFTLGGDVYEMIVFDGIEEVGGTMVSNYNGTERWGQSVITNDNWAFFNLPAKILHSTINKISITTPGSPANTISGDIDIRLKVYMHHWNSRASSVGLSKVNLFGFNNEFQYFFTLGTGGAGKTGQLFFVWSPIGLGNQIKQVVSTFFISPFNSGTVHWLRVTLDVDDGAGGHVVSFYSSSDNISWTLLEPPSVRAGTTSIGANFSPDLAVGGNQDGNSIPIFGRLYEAELYDGINGTLVANFKAEDWVSGNTVTSTATGEVWSLNNGAVVQTQTENLGKAQIYTKWINA